jgi:hypothetical protein
MAMNVRKRALIVAPVAMACLAVAMPLAADMSEWADDLKFQIREELNCEVNLISQVVERVVDRKRIVMAKVHCEDKRTFDAFRGEEFADFKFNECDPPEQKAC